MLNINEIYNEDCMETMKNIEDNSIDLVLTDCPYKIISGGCTKRSFKGETSGVLTHRHTEKRTDWVSDVRSGKMFKHNEILFSEWLPECYRLLKNSAHCYIMVNNRNLSDLQNNAEKSGFIFQNLLIWDKGNVTPNRWYMQGYECILMLRKGRAKNINSLGSSNIIRIPNIKGNKTHPTEKPVSLMRFLIENSTKTNEIVLDPFLGSGATVIACKESGRQYVGIEKDEKYFRVALERISQYKSEEQL